MKYRTVSKEVDAFCFEAAEKCIWEIITGIPGTTIIKGITTDCFYLRVNSDSDNEVFWELHGGEYIVINECGEVVVYTKVEFEKIYEKIPTRWKIFGMFVS